MNAVKMNLQAVILGVVLTALGYMAAPLFGWEAGGYLEAFCVFTSYVCTVLCVMRSRSNYFWGFASVIAYSALFYGSGLYSSMVLNIYLIPTLAWGWYRWGSDSNPRPVTRVSGHWWPVYITITVTVWWGLVQISTYMGATLPATDSFILAASILAQFLLDQKKIENWAVWVVVNVVAIWTYAGADLPMVVFQYVFFLANTVIGGYAWYKSMRPVHA